MAEEKKLKGFIYHITCVVSEALKQEKSPNEIIEIIKETYPAFEKEEIIFETLEYDEETGVFESFWSAKALHDTLLELVELKKQVNEKEALIQELRDKINQSDLELRQSKSKLEDWEKNFISVSKLQENLQKLEAISEVYEYQKNEFENLKKANASLMAENADFLKNLMEKSQEIGTLMKENADRKKENRILARSLIMAYEHYASISSRRLLELFSMFVFEMHNLDEKGNKGCETLQKDLKNKRGYMSTYKCLNHLKVCQLNSHELIKKFAESSDANTSLDLFVHSLSQDFNEIVISSQAQDTGLSEEIISDILSHLSEKFKSDKRAERLPKHILRMQFDTSYKDLACYQIASKIES